MKKTLMYCHQCQETAQNKGCSMTHGVCGKRAEVANLQDLLIWTLKGISIWAVIGKKHGIYDEDIAFFVDKHLFTTITNTDFIEENFIRYINEVIKVRDDLKAKIIEKENIDETSLAECALWSPKSDKDIVEKAESGSVGWLAIENEDIRSLKATILYGLKGVSAYLKHGYQISGEGTGKDIFEFLFEALAKLADEDITQDELIELLKKTSEMGVIVMKYLDEANTHYGEQEITEVNLGVRNNPGILISGHDLLDLEELLEQSKGKGVDVYTHGEMLPAHYRPFFKKYDNLVGNYGNAWHLQKDEIEKFNGPILFTSNCIVPPRIEHTDRIFTSGPVGFTACTYIENRKKGAQKDFSGIIKRAKQCQAPIEIENGTIVGGFGHSQVLKLADKIVEAIKSGKIKKFIVMAGCDGRHQSRSYYTEFAEKLPKDSIILTAGCAKYRYNKLKLGEIESIPRVLDAGQCNDSYSLVVIALKLKEALELEDVNELPISFNIAWYEQKAVLVLLALLHLGFKNIKLGPTLPGFLSENIAKFLIENYNIKGITTASEDVKEMMQ